MKKSLFDKSEELLLRKVVLKSPHYKAGHEGIIKYWYSGINVYFIELDDNSSTTVSRHDEMSLISKRKIDLRFSVWKPNIDKIMKLLIFLLLFSVSSFAQDTVRIRHANYTTVFSKSKHYPIQVDWWLCKSKVGCKSVRANLFAPDPQLYDETNLVRDYTHSGFDRGHGCNFEDNICLDKKVQKECFYYSNMCAEYHAVNAGSYKSLEVLCRNWALHLDSIHIWTGGIGEQKKIGMVSVPLKVWKVVYIVAQKQYKAYIFNNNKDDSGNGKNGLEVPLQTIKEITGLNCFN
jgi:DNA/RNA endonuclease G (NUC1)